MFHELKNDVRYAARALKNARLVSITTVVTVGIGVGLLTAIFSIVNAAVLRPLPYDGARRLVALTETMPRARSSFSLMSASAFAAVRERSRSFAALAAYTSLSLSVVADGDAESLSGADVTPSLFPLLRVSPVRGRVFTADDADAPVLLISHEFWTTRFGQSEAAIGSTMRVDGSPYSIIGVMPPGFNFPTRQHFWRALTLRPGEDDALEPTLGVAARLGEGVAIETARAEVASIGVSFARDHPGVREGWSMLVRSELLERRAIPGPLPWMAVTAGLFTLLIACANVATVLLARAASRRSDMAIRAALGASRRRLVAQQLTETLLLALAGGVAGLFVAMWTLDIAYGLLPTQSMPSWLDFSIDWHVLSFTLAVSVLTLLAVGLGPALVATRVNLSDPLTRSVAGDTGSRQELRMSRLLVVVEVATAFVLFAGSALMLRSARSAAAFDVGIDAEQVLSVRPLLSRARYATAIRRDEYVAAAVERLQRLPGAHAVATRGDLDSLRGAAWTSDSAGAWRDRASIATPGTEAALTFQEGASIRRYVVSSSYFDVVGLRTKRGRVFGPFDSERTLRVAIVSEQVANRLWPNVDPVGRQLRFGGSTELITVVGVVPNVRLIVGGPRGMSGRPESAIYLPATQASTSYATILMRAADPLATVGDVRRALRTIDPDQSIGRIERLSDNLRSAATATQWIAIAFAAMATGALLLAATGLYGVIAYFVVRRTREIGVRMALGADARTLRRSVVWQALSLTGAGVGIGIVGTLALVRLMGSFLYGVSSYDPVTYGLVAILFTALGIGASLVPAHRATRVDPLIALRAQ
jgi:putative ABC transport system permease protein